MDLPRRGSTRQWRTSRVTSRVTSWMTTWMTSTRRGQSGQPRKVAVHFVLLSAGSRFLHPLHQDHHFFTNPTELSLGFLNTALHLCLLNGKIVAVLFSQVLCSLLRLFLEAKIPVLAKVGKQAEL